MSKRRPRKASGGEGWEREVEVRVLEEREGRMARMGAAAGRVSGEVRIEERKGAWSEVMIMLVGRRRGRPLVWELGVAPGYVREEGSEENCVDGGREDGGESEETSGDCARCGMELLIAALRVCIAWSSGSFS